jgi:hypothetical protein
MAMSEHDHEPDQQPAEPGGPIRWTQASWPGTPSSAAQSTIDQMTDQLQAVIGAAERAAEAIRRDAEEQARLHLVEAQRQADRLTAERVGLISELTDDLIRHAANVRDHSEQMVRALEAAINSVTDKLDQPALSDRFEPAGQPPFGARPPAAPAPARPPEPAPPAQPVQPAPPDPAVQPAGAAQPVQPAQPTAPTTPAVPYTPPAAPGEPGPHPSGVYTDIVGAPPPPPPAWAPAPVAGPPLGTRHEPVTGPPQPTPEAAAAAAAGTGFGTAAGNSEARPPVEAPESEQPVPIDPALERARQPADAGVDRETITDVLRHSGVENPDPIVEQAFAGR